MIAFNKSDALVFYSAIALKRSKAPFPAHKPGIKVIAIASTGKTMPDRINIVWTFFETPDGDSPGDKRCYYSKTDRCLACTLMGCRYHQTRQVYRIHSISFQPSQKMDCC